MGCLPVGCCRSRIHRDRVRAAVEGALAKTIGGFRGSGSIPSAQNKVVSTDVMESGASEDSKTRPSSAWTGYPRELVWLASIIMGMEASLDVYSEADWLC